jgi:hypothetical protein
VRKADLLENHDEFEGALKSYRAFLLRIVDAQRVVSSVNEKRDVAESVLLRVCAYWEYFVDRQLIACVNRDPSLLPEYLGASLPSHPSVDLCEALLIGDRYLDFRSIGALKGYSKKVIPQPSNPFLKISTATANKIDEVYKLRNYLSHFSSKARRSLFAVYKSQYGMSRFYEPGQFLLARNGERLWAYFDAFAMASTSVRARY